MPRVDGVVTAVEAATGNTLWNFSTGGPLVQASASSLETKEERGNDDNDYGVECDDFDDAVILSAAELSLLNSIQRDGLQV